MKFAGNLLRRKALSQQVDSQFKQFCNRFELTGGSKDRTTLAHRLVGLAGRLSRCGSGITTKLAADD